MNQYEPAQQVPLDRDIADDLTRLLGRVEDWLRHASTDTRDDLAAFLDRPGNGALATAGLIHTLSCQTLHLQRLLREQDHR